MHRRSGSNPLPEAAVEKYSFLIGRLTMRFLVRVANVGTQPFVVREDLKDANNKPLVSWICLMKPCCVVCVADRLKEHALATDVW